MSFIWPIQQSVYCVFNPEDLNFTELCLALSQLKEYRFRHNFKDCINPRCCCSFEAKKICYFFLHCQHYSAFCMSFMNKVNQIDENFSCLSDDNKVNFLLYGDSRFDENKNNFILSASITIILEKERFLTSLFQSMNFTNCMNFYFSLTLILIFVSNDTFNFFILFYFN